MTIEKIRLDRYYKSLILIIPLIAILIALIFRFGGSDSENTVIQQVIHSLFYTAIIWLGCMSIVGLLWKRYPWELHPIKHLVLEIILILLFTNGFALLVYHLELAAGLINPMDDISVDILITNLITFLITTIHEAAFFYKQWKLNFSKSVRLEKDSIEAKYESLKAQINPHFLFNSLNSLTTLVDDNEEAVSYIQNLSEFLRYMLTSRDRELVLVREEVELARKYLTLQKSRFKNNLQIELDIPEKLFHYSLPPLVLQMLIENCVKHNIISKEKPLTINIYAEKDTLIVENKLQKKANNNSTGQGLKNIIDRYKFFTTREIKIEESSSTFKVIIPLLIVNL